jgi:hypothetical protein
MIGDGSDPKTVTPSPATTLPSQTLRTPTPGIAGTAPTDLLLWSIDPRSRLQVLDLDSGELRTLGNRGGIAFFGLLRQLVIFDGDEGSRVVTATGQTVSQNLGRGAFPVAVPDSQTLWVLSDASPRRWQRRAIDGALLDEIPFDASVWVVPYTDRAVLLSSIDGTSLFNLVTRQSQPLTATRVIAAAGRNLIGETCKSDGCTLTAIDGETRDERVLTVLPPDDGGRVTLSPDGRYLAIALKAFDPGHAAVIMEAPSGGPRWIHSASVFIDGSAWSWSPDSDWFFIKVDADRIHAVNVRDRSVPEIDIGLPLAAGQGIAVTRR